MDVLLLSGYRPEPLGTQTTEAGELWIDHQIRSLRELGLSPIVVLSGQHADEILRLSRRMEGCELVFDVNEDQANLFSNLRSGLHATEQACFVLPVEVTIPSEHVWKHLKMDLVSQGLLTAHHIIHIPPVQGAPWQQSSGFPLLISAVGNKAIRNLKDPTGLTDERIGYRRLGAPELATAAQNQ